MNLKSKKLKIFLMAFVWCASSGASYWYGRSQLLATEAANAARNKAKSNSLGYIDINHVAAGQAVPSLQDLLHTKGRPDANALKAWAASLDPAQCAGLLADLQKMPDGQPRDAIIAAMIGSWAGRDPQGYLKDYSTVTNPRARENGVGNALRALATQDPQAAAEWLKQSTDAVPNQLLAQRYRSVVQGMAATDPKAALAFAQSLDTTNPLNQQIQRQALNSIAFTMANNGNYADAMQMFSALPANEQGTATATLMRQWAQTSPADASNYVAGVTDPTQRSQMAADVAQSWARTDPQAAAAWAEQYDQSVSQSTGQPAGQALADAVRSWSQYDLTGAAQFLNTLPPSPSTDQAIASYSMQAGSVDPSDAMNWAGQITNPATRQQVAGAVAMQWLASDPADFSQNIANSTILSAQQKQFLGNLANNPQMASRIAQRINNGGRGGFGGGGFGGRFGGGGGAGG